MFFFVNFSILYIALNLVKLLLIVFLCLVSRNLQAAVGCFFDFSSGQKLPSMRILSDVTVGEGEGVTPNTPYVIFFFIFL